MSNITKHLIFTACWVVMFAIAVFLSGCVLTPSIEGIIDKSGKSIGTVIIAGAGKSLADTRKIKAKTVSSIKDDKTKAQVIKTQARWNGFYMFMFGILLALIINRIAETVRYFYPKPKEVKY